MAQDDSPPPLRVLVVDAISSTRSTVMRMLEELGHEPVAALDWPAAEQVLLLQEIGAVVMAFGVEGGFDGAASAALLRERLPPQGELPLIGTSSGLRRNEEQEALEAGFDALLLRPFGPEDLAAALERAIRDRTPPPDLDPERRAALRRAHGPAALEALDARALEAPATLLAPLFESGSAEDLAAAGTAIAEAMEAIGAVNAASWARRLAQSPGQRLMFPLMSAVVKARGALAKDRVTAAAQDPIWAASDAPRGDTPPGETP
ncbi:response regulator [Roseomonas alkaliterrae]|uniref:CheY-like chemotaxis protein n=1 Tax=Neoroseomonas alkaliterrae TaxID=1452450 RepID=A0A840Y0C6_9PROT|nr:response regulator [Neoroseomonas alkaliterrae]MBB5688102.1 CheY-like chemotaxis protein [Neoroseomonas alkaliterrae]MBR0674974.1 response regulator [Neoroseomonas alkaliterrae]